MAAYNKRAKQVGRPLTVLDTNITAALVKESAAIIASSAASRFSGYKGIEVVPSGKFKAKIYDDGEAEHLGSEYRPHPAYTVILASSPAHHHCHHFHQRTTRRTPLWPPTTSARRSWADLSPCLITRSPPRSSRRAPLLLALPPAGPAPARQRQLRERQGSHRRAAIRG